MNDVGMLSAFIAGVLSFLAPCTFPLVPAYLGFLGGGNLSSPDGGLRVRILKNALLFVLGFTLVFVVFGLVSGVLGEYLILYRSLVARIGGVLVVILGLHMLGLFRLSSFVQGYLFFEKLAPGTLVSSFLLGLFFGFAWTPCLGPILGTILFLAGSTGQAGHGALLLFLYSSGIAFPFLLLAYAYTHVFSVVVRVGKYLTLIERVSGVVLVTIGILLVFGKFGLIGLWAGELLRGEWYDSLMNYM